MTRGETTHAISKKEAYVACHGVFDFLIEWREACLGVSGFETSGVWRGKIGVV